MAASRTVLGVLVALVCWSTGHAMAVPGPVADYFGRFKAGIEGQYTSFQECQRIRKKRKTEPDEPITFAEHHELRQGVEDRWKIVTLGVWYNFSPEMATFFTLLPSAWPTWLPSRFHSAESVAAKVNDAGRKRIWDSTQALRKMDDKLYNLEKQANPNKPPDAPPNQRRAALQQTMATLAMVFQAKTKAEAVDGLITLYDGDTSESLDLNKLPRPVVVAACKCAGIDGFLTPGFMKRNKLMEHLKHLKAGDEALLAGSEVPSYLLQKACTERAIGSPRMSEEKLHASVHDYLKLVKTYEARHDPLGVRLALLGANTVEAVRVAPEAGIFRTFFGAEGKHVEALVAGRK